MAENEPTSPPDPDSLSPAERFIDDVRATQSIPNMKERAANAKIIVRYLVPQGYQARNDYRKALRDLPPTDQKVITYGAALLNIARNLEKQSRNRD